MTGDCYVLLWIENIREIKHDVYGKRQTAKMKLLPSLFSCVYSRVKLFLFAMNSRRRYSTFVCFIYGLKEKDSKSEVVFAVCRLPLTSCLTSLLMRFLRRGVNSTGLCTYLPCRYFASGFSSNSEKKA